MRQQHGRATSAAKRSRASCHGGGGFNAGSAAPGTLYDPSLKPAVGARMGGATFARFSSSRGKNRTALGPEFFGDADHFVYFADSSFVGVAVGSLFGRWDSVDGLANG